MENKWLRTGVDKMTLEGTNYSLRKTIYNDTKVVKVFNFNTCVGMAGNIKEAKKLVKLMEVL